MYKFDFKNNLKKEMESSLDEYFDELIHENQTFINKKILIHHYKVGKLLNDSLDKESITKQLKQISDIMIEKYDSTFTVKTLKTCMKFADLFFDVSQINFDINWPYYVFILELENKDDILNLINKCSRENLSLYELKIEIKKYKNK